MNGDIEFKTVKCRCGMENATVNKICRYCKASLPPHCTRCGRLATQDLCDRCLEEICDGESDTATASTYSQG